jgi:hypothetical protein
MTRLFFFALGYAAGAWLGVPGFLLTLWFGMPTACDKEDVPVVNIRSNAPV